MASSVDHSYALEEETFPDEISVAYIDAGFQVVCSTGLRFINLIVPEKTFQRISPFCCG